MTDSVPIVVYLLLVLTGVIEVSLLKQKPIHPTSQTKPDFDIGLDTRTVGL